MQNNSRLPFFYYESSNIYNEVHWHQGIELNYLMKGEDLRFVIDGHTYHFNEGDMWSVNRRHVHSSTGERKDWHYH